MDKRENYLRAARFETPDYIPVVFAVNPACWEEYDNDAMCELMESHPLLFPGFTRPPEGWKPSYSPIARADEEFVDDFGCVWRTAKNGFTGTVLGHPLTDWDAFDRWTPPDPAVCMGIGPIDWAAERARAAERRSRGELVMGGLRHGHTFLQLSDLRGYENLLFDFEDEEPRLWDLIDAVERFNRSIVERYLDIGVDVMTYAEDLGMQRGPMLSPTHFRKYIQPSYRRLMQPARDAGLLIHMHSDGDIRNLIQDILDGGVDIINLQDLVNGVDWIARTLKGKHCVEVDIDRQSVTVYGVPADVEEHVAGIVKTLGGRAGGLMLIFGWYPGSPIENIAALMDALERYMYYFA